MALTALARAVALTAAIGIAAPSRPALAADGRGIAANGTAQGAPACSACHGAGGEGNPEGGIPRLSGLDAGYLAHELASFADGSRANEVMGPTAKALSPDERRAVAAYYAAEAAPNTAEPAPPDRKLAARGEALALIGDWGKGLPACAQCHGPAGQGVGASFPALAGQSAAYVAAQLAAWKAGTRRNDPLHLMAGVAGKLGEDDVRAVAAYYAGLPAPQVVARKDAKP